MVSITDLEMAGCELDNSGVTVPVMYPSAPAASYEMDTYSRDNFEEDEPVQKVAECPINKMNEEEKMDLLKRQHSESAKLHSAIHQKASLDVNL